MFCFYLLIVFWTWCSSVLAEVVLLRWVPPSPILLVCFIEHGKRVRASIIKMPAHEQILSTCSQDLVVRCFYTPGVKTKLCYKGFLLKKKYIWCGILLAASTAVLPQKVKWQVLHKTALCNLLKCETSQFWGSECISADTVLSLPVSSDLGGFLSLCHLKSHRVETWPKSCQPCCFFFSTNFITSIYLPPQIKVAKKETKDV